MKTKLKPYRGKLNAQQLVDGMNAAFRNARRLVEDAKTLLDLSRYPTAAALAILSIEENGKGGVLRNVAMAPNEEIRRKMWNDYTIHKRKNVAWILPEMIAKGARDLDSLRPIVEPTATHPALLDQYKQLALYTDCIGNAHWSEPEKSIEEVVARELVDTANRLTEEKKMVALKEIELWIMHMKPVSFAPWERQKEALVNYYEDLKENGLWEDGNVSVKDFIMGFHRKGTQRSHKKSP